MLRRGFLVRKVDVGQPELINAAVRYVHRHTLLSPVEAKPFIHPRLSKVDVDAEVLARQRIQHNLLIDFEKVCFRLQALITLKVPITGDVKSIPILFLFPFICHSVLLSPLGKLANRAVILPMFFFFILYIFDGRHSTTCFSESNRLIFTKISGLVDGWKGLLT